MNRATVKQRLGKHNRRFGKAKCKDNGENNDAGQKRESVGKSLARAYMIQMEHINPVENPKP